MRSRERAIVPIRPDVTRVDSGDRVAALTIDAG
jgi:hypothetical protein